MTEAKLEKCLFITNTMSDLLKGDARIFTCNTGNGIWRKLNEKNANSGLFEGGGSILTGNTEKTHVLAAIFGQLNGGNANVLVDSFRAPVAQDATVFEPIVRTVAETLGKSGYLSGIRCRNYSIMMA